MRHGIQNNKTQHHHAQCVVLCFIVLYAVPDVGSVVNRNMLHVLHTFHAIHNCVVSGGVLFYSQLPRYPA
jgi:hypothetical protein